MEQELPALVETESPEVRGAVVQLLQADIIHDATKGRSDRANIERYCWLMALKAHIDIVDNLAPDLRDAKLSAALVRLMAALEDLDRGKVNPALRPRTRSRHDTGPRSRHDSTLRGHLAGVVEGLMGRGAGMSEPEAAHWVQRRLSARGVELTADQLIAWRKQARAPKRDAFMRRAFHKALIEDWGEPEARAERLVENFLKLI